jgi:hypothetical protein
MAQRLFLLTTPWKWDGFEEKELAIESVLVSNLDAQEAKDVRARQSRWIDKCLQANWTNFVRVVGLVVG